MYAGFWNRFAAFFFDYLILLVPLWIVSFVFSLMGAAMAIVGAFAIYILIWLYEAFLLSSSMQATVGKLILGVQVRDLDGNGISFLRATGRFWSKFIGPVAGGILIGIGTFIGGVFAFLMLLIGFIVMLAPFVIAAFNPQRRALHDLIAGTIVVDRNTVAGSEPSGIKPGVGWAITTSVAVTLTPVFVGIFAGIFAGAALLGMAGGATASIESSGSDFAAKSTVDIADSVVGGVKFEVEQYAQTHDGIYPSSTEELTASGASLPTELPGATLAISGDGQIVVTLTEPAEIAGTSLQYTPSSEGGLTNWTCTSPDVKDEYLPDGCTRP